MGASTKHGRWKKRLVNKVTCPNCWREFPPEDVRYIASPHPDLLGDPILGAEEYVRFSPARFTLDGKGLDPHGVEVTDLACPRCHLPIHEGLLEMPPIFISLIGSPASGKSYFLATMTHFLRTLLPRAALSFNDTCPALNEVIREYEVTLFGDPDSDEPTEIQKTSPDDPRLYKDVTLNEMTTRFPMPMQFSIWPTRLHPDVAQAHRIGRVLVLYDNAGEDFLPGADGPTLQAVRHLARSGIFFMLFDPAQEPALRKFCRSEDPQVSHGLRPDKDSPAPANQETLLTEAAGRVRRHLGLSQGKRLDKPLVVIIPKFDILNHAVGLSIDEEPYTESGNGGPLKLDTKKVEEASTHIRELLWTHCPNFVATAENLTDMICYIPVSSFGCSPVLVEQGQAEKPFYGVRPCDLQPRWVTVPLLYCLTKWSRVLLERR